MNFLAHLYLSGADSNIIVGNFIGDFVKGKNFEEKFGKQIANGIELHREIDWFTDHHSVVRQSKERLRGKYRHYSGVIVDVFCDHFLAKNWRQYSPQQLPHFADKCYQLIAASHAILPQEAKHMVPYMIKQNWLVNYAKVEGIQRALSGMAQRTKFESKMDEAIMDLKNNYSIFEDEFFLFFPDLIKMCNEWLKTHQENEHLII